MDVEILIQEVTANWQWYHGVAVGLGSAGCIIGGIFLLSYIGWWLHLHF